MTIPIRLEGSPTALRSKCSTASWPLSRKSRESSRARRSR